MIPDISSPKDLLCKLASDFDNLSQKSNTISDICIRSIADTSSAFETRGHGLLDFLKRQIQRFIGKFKKNDVTFTILDSGRTDRITLQVGMYDTKENVNAIRRLFKLSLLNVKSSTSETERKRMEQIMSFALHCDKMVQGPLSEKTCHELFLEYLQEGSVTSLPEDAPKDQINTAFISWATSLTPSTVTPESFQKLCFACTFIKKTLSLEEKALVGDYSPA